MSLPSPDALLHLATLHLLSQAGFASTSQAASLSLTSVVGEYFKLVARSTVDRALHAGRAKPGIYDVVGSLEDLGYGMRLEDLYEYGLESGRDTLEGEGLEKLAGKLKVL
jgi:histone H3/H4